MSVEPLAAVGVTIAPTGYSGLWVAGIPRPDHGEGMCQLVCDVCLASWVGRPGDPCRWCEDRCVLVLADERRRLLHPDWLGGCRGPRYDEVCEIDKAVWDRTRGQQRGADALRRWAAELARAVERGAITDTEARGGLARQEGRWAS